MHESLNRGVVPGGIMQPTTSTPPPSWGSQYGLPALVTPTRGVTIGIGLELLGIAVAILGLATGTLYFAGSGVAYQPNATVAGLGVLIALIGLGLHAARA
jgi:hypothetical protein